MRYRPNMEFIYRRLIVLVIMLVMCSAIMAEERGRRYVGSKRSDKYHLPDCKWAKKIGTQNQIWFDTVAEAQSAKYLACSICDPGREVATEGETVTSGIPDRVKWFITLVVIGLGFLIGMILWDAKEQRDAKKRSGGETMNGERPEKQNSSKYIDTPITDEVKKRIARRVEIFKEDIDRRSSKHQLVMGNPANLTNSEYLDLFFRIMLHQHPDPLSGLSDNIVVFLPARSPRVSLVMIMQILNDKSAHVSGWFSNLTFSRVSKKQRKQNIIDWSTGVLKVFEDIYSLPQIAERWSITTPSEHILIRYIRSSSDSEEMETLAVTVNGETVFDKDGFERARTRVEAAGGIWIPDGSALEIGK